MYEYAKVVCECILDFAKEIKENTRLRAVHLVNFNQSHTNALYTALKDMCFSPKRGPEAWSPSGMRGYSKASTQPKFDSSKYKKLQIWDIVANSQSSFESFIEKVRETSQIENEKSDQNKKEAGNIVFIDLDEEEDGGSNVENAEAINDVDKAENEPLMCIICMDDKMEDPVMLKYCQHKFCRSCIEEYFSQKPVCPVCSKVYGEIFGNQPPGTATVYFDSNSLPGYNCSTIIIHYEIPDGMQTVRLIHT